MDLFGSSYYKLNRNLMSFVGLWPFLKPKDMRVRAFIMSVILFLAIIPQISNVFTTKLNEFLLNSSIFFLPYLCIVSAYYTVYYKAKEIKFIVEYMIVDWNVLKPDELKIVEKYAAQSRLLTRILIYSFYIPIFMIFLLSLIPHILDDFILPSKKHEHKFVYPMELFIDKDKHPYVNIFIVNLLIAIISIISMANYTIYLAFVQHACALFRVIGYILENAITEKEENVSCTIESNEIYFKIIRGIKYHKRAIQYTEFLNSASEFCYLVQVVISLIILAIDIMGLLRINGRSVSMTIVYTMHISGIICWLFFNCIIGQKVADHSTIVFDKTCTIPWYLFPPRIQKLAIILLIRSAKPSYLSVGKMFVSSHEFFVAIIQTSISYGMVLHSL